MNKKNSKIDTSAMISLVYMRTCIAYVQQVNHTQ